MELRIKELCKERGLTLQQVAEYMGVNRVSLSNSINGNPTIGTLEKIATALNVDVVELFAKRGDFVAFVRDQGKIYTFDTIEALKEFTDAAHELTEKMRQLGEAIEVAKSKEK